MAPRAAAKPPDDGDPSDPWPPLGRPPITSTRPQRSNNESQAWVEVNRKGKRKQSKAPPPSKSRAFESDYVAAPVPASVSKSSDPQPSDRPQGLAFAPSQIRPSSMNAQGNIFIHP